MSTGRAPPNMDAAVVAVLADGVLEPSSPFTFSSTGRLRGCRFNFVLVLGSPNVNYHFIHIKTFYFMMLILKKIENLSINTPKIPKKKYFQHVFYYTKILVVRYSDLLETKFENAKLCTSTIIIVH